MNPVIQFAGDDHTLQLLGVRLIGITPENGKKLLMSVVFVLLLWAGNRLLHALPRQSSAIEQGGPIFG